MSEPETRRTEETARRYFAAWTTRDNVTVRKLLAPDFKFRGGDMSIDGRDAFLDGRAFPRDAATTIVAEAYQGETAFQMYDAARGSRNVRIVEQLTVRGGLIRSSNFVADMTAFMALLAL